MRAARSAAFPIEPLLVPPKPITDPLRPCLANARADITTLGGAGFASQSYTFPADAPLAIPSSSFAGVSLRFLPSPSSSPDAHSEKHAHKPRTLTLVLKTAAPPAKRPDGRLEATLSYEAHVVAPSAGGTINIRWSEFEATYRGKPQKDAPKFETSQIRAIGLMCRSDFGAQAGPFEFLLAGVDGLARSRSWAARLRALFARLLSWISC